MVESDKRSWFFPTAFVGESWAENVLIAVCNGRIQNIETDVESIALAESPEIERIDGIAIPGMVNVHSHAFQRAFAGLSEHRTGEHDSFWTWRQLMFECATRWHPEDIYAIAVGLYGELLKNGYTWVGEFQYLHNDVGGAPYADESCMSDALVRAANECGIGICIMPVLYQRAGFRGGELDPAQQRFSMGEEAFQRLLGRLQQNWRDSPNVRVGMAIHSLRAVPMDVIDRVTQDVRRDHPEIPIHIHVAEQTQEVADCQAAFGRRPVEYLLSETNVDRHWCLIHATHVEAEEIRSIVEAGAVVGVCPTTEANLGDGVFPAAAFLDAGGQFAIGSDSHVSTSPRSELRLFEYAQRLTTRQRAILGTESESVGRRLYPNAAQGGAKALGIETGRIAVDWRADLVIIDPTHPAIQFVTGDRIFDRYIFCDSGNPVSRVMIGGEWIL